MIEDNAANEPQDTGGPSLFVVRLGDGEGAAFAICERVGTVEGSRRLPGTGRTVAELVAEQALAAAAVSGGDAGGLDNLMFMAQSGQNELGAENE